METLQDATAKICELRGAVQTLHAVMNAILRVLPPSDLPFVVAAFEQEAESMRAVMLGEPNSDAVLSGFERDAQHVSRILGQLAARRARD